MAYDLYNKVVVMTLDAKQYSWWATTFVPSNYGRVRTCELAFLVVLLQGLYGLPTIEENIP